MMRDFRQLLQDGRPHLFDGAMGTMLYAKGVFINRSYDELNLRDPGLVREVHRAYVRAGAEIIETNSYGANRPKLERHGLDGELGEINPPRRRNRARCGGASACTWPAP